MNLLVTIFINQETDVSKIQLVTYSKAKLKLNHAGHVHFTDHRYPPQFIYFKN